MITLNNKIPVSITMGGKNVETIKMGNEIVWGRVQEMFYIENTYAGSNVVTLTTTNAGTVDSSKYASSIQYSKDGLNWTNQTLSSTATISLSQGERVYFRGSQGVFNYYENNSVNNITKFSAQYSHKVGGNINSLLNYNNMYNVPLTQGCFESLFNGDTTLTSASDLYMPSTTLVAFCYDQLFMGCTSLTNYPQQPVQTMAANCMRSMYRGCTSLVNPPSLPSTSLYPHCYNKLFMDCTSLTSAPVLPATTMKASCYRQMFSGCSALTTAPELPATSLSDSCYRQMFENTGLTTSPKLPAKTISQNAYYQMFQGCSNLNKVYVYADDNSATDCTYNWLSSVAATGTFVNYGTATYTIDSDSGIPVGWTEPKNEYLYIENTYPGESHITFTKYTSSDSTKTIQYSKDKQSWTSFTPNFDTPYRVTLKQGEKLYLRGSGGTRPNLNIWGANDHIVGGNINTLLDYTNPNGVSMPQYAFYNLFNGDIYLKSAKYLVLPSMTLTKYCYDGLFHSCYALTTPPVLPATTLAESSYSSMFYGCSALISGPTLLATTLVKNCYYQLFKDCTSLNEVTTYANNISASGCLNNWLSGVASTGTFHNLGSATYPTGTSGIPSGWTVETTPPNQ